MIRNDIFYQKLQLGLLFLFEYRNIETILFGFICITSKEYVNHHNQMEQKLKEF
jgi:hypothetical protein